MKDGGNKFFSLGTLGGASASLKQSACETCLKALWVLASEAR